eukprot:9263777-Pyramimonas_sp.AAC.1
MDSPNSRDGRRVLPGCAGDGATAVFTACQATLLIHDLRAHLGHLRGIALGRALLTQDPGALVIEFSELGAIAAPPDSWGQLIPLTSSKSALITPSSAT